MSEVPPDSQNIENDTAKAVGKAGVIMMASLILSRVLGIIRDMIMAAKFGATGLTDAYDLAFQVPDLLFYLISGGALSSAFIPVFSEYWATDRRSDAWKVFSAVLTIMSLVVALFIGVCFINAESIAGYVAAGKSGGEFFDEIVTMSKILLPAQFAFFIGGIMMGTLYARKVFSIPGLGPNIYNIGIILGAVLISYFVKPGIIGACIGATAGAIIGNLIIPFLAIKKMGFEFKPTLSIEHEGTRKVFKLMLPVVLGLSLPGVFAMIMRYFGSFYPEGTNTVLSYGNKLMQAPLGIFGQSLAIAIFPVLSQFFAQQKMDMFRTQLTKTMKTVIYLCVPCSMLMAILADQICGTLCQGGQFSAERTHQTAVVLRFFSIGIWAWCLHPILMRAFYSIQDTLTPIIIGTVTTAVFIGLVLVLRNTSLTYHSLPLAGSIAPILMVLVMLLVLSPRIGGLEVRQIAVTLGKSMIGSLAVLSVSGLIAFTPVSAMIANSKGWTVIVTFFGCMFSVWAYYFITKKLQMPETEYLDRAMNKINRVGRKS